MKKDKGSGARLYKRRLFYILVIVFGLFLYDALPYFCNRTADAGILNKFPFSLIFGGEKASVEMFNKKNTQVDTKLANMENSQIQFKSEMEKLIDVKIVGYDKSVDQKITAIGSTINDTGLLKATIGGLITLCASLVVALVTFMKLFFKYLREKKDWKRLYYEKEVKKK